ncbi:response regulator [bacterium]|nr:response regulator [bacterium]
MSLSVLIVDDEEEIRSSLTNILSTIGYPAISAAGSADAMRHAAEFSPDVVLLDIHLNDEIDGIELCRRIKADPAAKNPYVLMLTAAADRRSVQAALAAGAGDYIVKPFKMSVLVQKLVRLAMSGSTPSTKPPQTFRILVVDDEVEIQKSMTQILSSMGYQTESAANARQTLKIIREFDPHLVLLDINLPHSLDGIEICRRLKESGSSKSPKVIMMTGVSDKAIVQKAMDAGAVDYLVKPFKTPHLLRKLARHLLGADAALAIPVDPEDEVVDAAAADAAEDEPPPSRRRGSGLASARAAVEEEPSP